MPSTSNSSLPLTNGHLSPLAHNVTNASDLSSRSGSELSEAKDGPPAEAPSSGADSQGLTLDGDTANMVTSESSHTEDADGSEDAEYDAETPAPAQSDAGREDPPSEESSARSRKRKASINDDDYMLQDPELYGLRRSVRLSFTSSTTVTDPYPRVVLVPIARL